MHQMQTTPNTTDLKIFSDGENVTGFLCKDGRIFTNFADQNSPIHNENDIIRDHSAQLPQDDHKIAGMEEIKNDGDVT